MCNRTESALINEGVELTESKKLLETRLKEIKALLEHMEVGDHKTSKGSKLSISETDKFSEIDPEELMDFLKSKKQSKRFWVCVKVAITPLRKHVPDNIIKKMRSKVGTTLRFTFK